MKIASGLGIYMTTYHDGSCLLSFRNIINYFTIMIFISNLSTIVTTNKNQPSNLHETYFHFHRM